MYRFYQKAFFEKWIISEFLKLRIRTFFFMKFISHVNTTFLQERLFFNLKY